MVLVVMGVSGSGKTSVGQSVAQQLGFVFLEADDFHPKANIEKMARGEPLNDEDRWPWLDSLNAAGREHDNAVVTCSALKKIYRQRLAKGLANVRFVYLKAPAAVIDARMKQRAGHFMKAGMLESQLRTLEEPGPDEALIVETQGKDIQQVSQEVAAYFRNW